MSNKSLHGLERKHELNEEFLYRDTRSAIQKFNDWKRKPQNMAIFFLSAGILAILFPAVNDYIFIVGCLFFLMAMKVQESCPIKMPSQSGLNDVNEPHPATGAASKAKGIFFLGNEVKTAKEIWLTNDDCRQHFLVIGTTGAGKTETLIGFAANSLIWGSGLLFCDGKGDVSVFAKLYALTRRFGREDDLLVLNFMTGNSDLGATGGKIKSNTVNPFSTGSSDSLTQMVVSLMDDSGGEGGMWKGRATAMLTGIMRALCWLRDNGILELNVGAMREFMNLDKIIDLADETKYPEMPPQIRGSIKAYLRSLPGFQEDKGKNQGNTTRDQHGYLEMQFTKILGSLADVYGHIFKTEYGEVDMSDVVLNRRILFVMLPALEKSGDELANLGKIVVANLKGMMGSTLGSEIEGTWYDVVENRQTTSSSPFITILDEVGYYAVEGLALIAAQARSIGFSMVYASQDIPAMERRNEKEAASIIANTNTKVFMRMEEVEKSGKLAVESSGKAIKAQVSGYQGRVSEMGGGGYVDSKEARLEMSERVSFRDLKSQGAGEMHIIYQDNVVRARGFYANPEASLDTGKLSLRANHFIKVVAPSLDDLEANERLPEIMEKLVNPEFVADIKIKEKKAISAVNRDDIDEISLSSRIFTNMDNAKRNPMEGGCGAVGAIAEAMANNISLFNQEVERIRNPKADIDVDDEDDDRRNPFASEQNENSRRSFSDLRKLGQHKKRRSLVKDVDHEIEIDDDEPIDMSKVENNNDTIMRALAAMDFDTEDDVDEKEIDKSIDDALLDKISDSEEGGDNTLEGDAEVDISEVLDASGVLDDNIANYIEDDDAFTIMEEEDKSDGDTETKSGGKEGEEEEDLTAQFLRSLMGDEDEDDDSDKDK